MLNVQSLGLMIWFLGVNHQHIPSQGIYRNDTGGVYRNQVRGLNGYQVIEFSVQ